MAYKTLFTVLTDESAVQSLLPHAVTLARRWDAHLDVLCCGVHKGPPTIYTYAATVMLDDYLEDGTKEYVAELKTLAEKTLTREDVRYGIETSVSFSGEVTPVIASRARFADLVLLPLPANAEWPRLAQAMLEATLFNAHVPVLVVPDGAGVEDIGRRVLVGWNDSDPALAAIRGALPLLSEAGVVDVAVVDPPEAAGEGLEPGNRLAEMLAHHGAKVELAEVTKTQPRIADVLLRRARNTDATLLVTGAFGHSRLREAIIGGATKDLLDMADRPLLLAH